MFELLADWLIYDLAGLEGSAFGAAAAFLRHDVTKILVLLTLVIYIMGLLRRAALRPSGCASSSPALERVGAVPWLSAWAR